MNASARTAAADPVRVVELLSDDLPGEMVCPTVLAIVFTQSVMDFVRRWGEFPSIQIATTHVAVEARGVAIISTRKPGQNTGPTKHGQAFVWLSCLDRLDAMLADHCNGAAAPAAT